MFILEKKLMDEGQRKFEFPFNLGDLLSHTIHLRRLCEPCVFTHTCKREKKPSPTLSPPLTEDSSASLHLINFYRGGHPKLNGCCRRAEVALQTARDFASTAFCHLSAPTFLSAFWERGTQNCLPAAHGVAPSMAWYGPPSASTTQDPREADDAKTPRRSGLLRLAPEERRSLCKPPPREVRMTQAMTTKARRVPVGVVQQFPPWC